MSSDLRASVALAFFGIFFSRKRRSRKGKSIRIYLKMEYNGGLHSIHCNLLGLYVGTK